MIENRQINDDLDLWITPDKVWGIVPGNREYNILQNLSPGNWVPEPETGPGRKRSGDKRFTLEQIQRHSTLTREHRWIILICIFEKKDFANLIGVNYNLYLWIDNNIYFAWPQFVSLIYFLILNDFLLKISQSHRQSSKHLEGKDTL